MENIYQAKGVSFIEQYRDVGKLFQSSIQESVRKIAKSRAKMQKIRRSIAERAWLNLRTIGECHEFIECFIAWCDGAQITPVQGMWLMADNLSGCQTLTVRYASGVALLHSEEEFRDTNHMDLHMTSPHTIAFLVNGEEFKSLVYNNLFPGAGLYGWKRDMIVAVDSIFLKEDGIEEVKNPVLANVIAWMVWRMTPSQASPEAIISLLAKMGTLIDGYVLNIVRRVDDEVQGYKLILARDESKIVRLGKEVGNYLKQVNIVDPNEVKIQCVLPPRNIWKGGWKYFTNRIKTLRSHAKEYQYLSHKKIDLGNLNQVHLVIQQTIFGDLAESYVHADLGAVCAGFVDDSTGTSVSCKLNDGILEGLAYIDSEI